MQDANRGPQQPVLTTYPPRSGRPAPQECRSPELVALAPTPVRHRSVKAAVARGLHGDPWLAAHVTHVAARDGLVADINRAVVLAAIMRRDAFAARVDAVAEG